MKPEERLTSIEASFIGLERRHMPMHVAGLVLLRSARRPLKIDEIQRLAAVRLRRAPRFHQLLRTSSGRSPVWEPAGRIRPDSHFFRHVLMPPGSESQLLRLCAEIHEEVLDRDQPLWEVHLIDGVAGNRQALLIKTHHAITDGLAGVNVAERLFDPEPGAPRPRPPLMRFAQPHAPSLPWTALQALVGLAFTAAGGPLAIVGPFNGRVSAHRAFAISTLSMQSVKNVKRQLGFSVNDVLTATVAAGLGQYLREVQYPWSPRALRAMLPVSTRGPVHGMPLGNEVSAIFVDLPMDEDDLPTLVRRIAEAKATLRTAHAAAGSSLLVNAAGLLPAPLHVALLRLVSALPFANLVLSDVPGPDQDLYLLGRRIDACYPMMPLSSNVGLSIATISMGGTVGIGVTADPLIVPDAQGLASTIQRAWLAFVAPPAERSRQRRAA